MIGSRVRWKPQTETLEDLLFITLDPLEPERTDDIDEDKSADHGERRHNR